MNVKSKYFERYSSYMVKEQFAKANLKWPAYEMWKWRGSFKVTTHSICSHTLIKISVFSFKMLNYIDLLERIQFSLATWASAKHAKQMLVAQ